MSQERFATTQPHGGGLRQQLDPDELPPTLSVEDAGAILGISRRSAYRAAANGELPALRLGRRLRVPTQRLLAMLGTADPPPDPATQEPTPSDPPG